MGALLFDGFDVTRYAYVRMEAPPGPPNETEAVQLAGVDGEWVTSSTHPSYDVVAHCTLRAAFLGSWASVRRELRANLCGKGECPLVLPDDPDLTWTATASFDGSVTTPVVAPVEFDIVFSIHDVEATGAVHSHMVTAGQTCYFEVQGTRHPQITITASAQRNATNYLWGVQFDNGDRMRVKIPTALATPVTIDCADRKALVATEVSMVTLDSDWPKLDTGPHTVRIDVGTGYATLTIKERYL